MVEKQKKIIIYLIERFKESDLAGTAAQMAYFFLLSIFPLMIFTVTLLAFLPFTTNDLFALIQDFAPEQTMNSIQKMVEEVVETRNSSLLSFGVIGTVWSASNGMNAIIKGLNHAYNVEETRPFYTNRGISILLTFGFILIVAVALVLQVFGRQLGLLATSYFNISLELVTLWNWLRWSISPILIFSVFVGLYYFAPSLKVKLGSVIPGAAFATLGWIAASFGFSFYVNNFGNYSATYGSIGGIIIMMIWFYLTAFIILIGGEINAYKNSEAKSNV
ncbi:YihY/virulence factor BrkB family protein [Bacillus sp. REN10]|uniref:YihY/virulence factor BrkB family protein n=1 Tax=Bacillus sp. REN10 TaxID=2782541 RepID=UPI00193B7CE6|nr:YihY/virulence factor BrkB family protein [Bacillus sp. REN10]